MDRPRYVVGTGVGAKSVLRRLVHEGWRTRETFVLPEAAWDVSRARLVLFGRVCDPDGVRQVTMAATRGAGIVAVVDCDSGLSRILLAELRRIGPVMRGPQESGTESMPLTDEQCQLLARLAGGETIAAAASAEYLSLRTANRRIAQARLALGVSTTREAILMYLGRKLQ
ncbi:MAG: LuxR family transcriptional regulator [Longispora sp.]|nr:LuxR family transcriptional regulator [Longispora sp. (in: high G+C Gram-positive bacteria)]